MKALPIGHEETHIFVLDQPVVYKMPSERFAVSVTAIKITLTWGDESDTVLVQTSGSADKITKDGRRIGSAYGIGWGWRDHSPELAKLVAQAKVSALKATKGPTVIDSQSYGD